MTHDSAAPIAAIETTTVQVLVTLRVAPQSGQTLDDAGSKMRQLFEEYLTLEDSAFRSDYGATLEELSAFRADPDEHDEPTWGGYEGPFVVDTVVQSIEPAGIGD